MAPTPVRARWAISAQFFTNGVLGGSLLPRFPEIKTTYGLNDLTYGFVLMAMPLGALFAMTVAGPLIRRFGALRVAATFTVIYAALLALAGASPNVVMFAGAMLLAGVCDNILDSGQNVHGLAVERWSGKSIINSMHAAWSLGATLGGLIGATCASMGISVGWQMAVSALVWSAVAVGAALAGAVPERFVRSAVPSADDGSPLPSPSRRFPWKLFIPLAILAIAGTLVEEIANNWVTLFLHREQGAAIGLAGIGFAITLGAQFVGRLVGDPMTDRFGRATVARWGGLLIAGGGVLAIASPWVALSMIGFALAGFGTATLVPAAFAAADSLPGVAHGTGVAMVGWWMRLGFMLTSPVVGALAEGIGLRLALLVMVGGGVAAAAMAGKGRRS
ncbi:MAG: MFS transporter [bacterium]|nr:MFS transporter [bacterium]